MSDTMLIEKTVFARSYSDQDKPGRVRTVLQ